MPRYPQKVVVLLSGGLDSNVTLAHLVAQPVERVERVHALIFDYAQSSSREMSCAEQLCLQWKVPYTIQRLDPAMLCGKTDIHQEIPARNLIFIALAAAFAADLGFDTIALGAEPDSTYTDSTIAFLDKTSDLLGHFGMSLIAPVKRLTNKVSVVHRALDLGVPLHLCHSSRSNVVDGQCKTSQLFLEAITCLLPNGFLSARAILAELALVEAHHDPSRNIMYLRYNTPTEPSSFKYAAALFTVLGSPLMAQGISIHVHSTGSWMNDLARVCNLPGILDAPHTRLIYHQTEDLHRILNQPVNCDNMWAQWGIKQAVACLPRPRYLKAVACRLIQGHLGHVLHELGYELEAPAYRHSILLETAPTAW